MTSVRLSTLLGLAIASVVGGCYGLQTYACSEDGNCVDGSKTGRCEPSGYCSYPDDSCPSDQRYDDLAPGELAGSCVDEAATDASSTTSSTNGATTTRGSVGTTTLQTTGEESSESSTGPGDCLDEDADGYGEGNGCLGLDCDDDNPQATDNCLYVSPNGDDANVGSIDAPWGTLAHATAMLSPGSSLVLLPGEYTGDGTGFFNVDCANGPAQNGAPESRIYVRAAEERTAHIATMGADSGIRILDCADWSIRGLHISASDNPDGLARSPVGVERGLRIEFRRILAHTTNRYIISPLYTAGESVDTLFEDCEAYDFSAGAFFGPGATGTTYRRIYADSRGRADLDGCVDPDVAGQPVCSNDPDRGDHGIILGDGATVENVIIEDVDISAVGIAKSDLGISGSMFIESRHGVILSVDTDGPLFSTGGTIQDVFGLRLENRSVYLRSVQDVAVRNATAIESGGVLRSDQFSSAECPGGCATFGANLLAVQSTSDGVAMLDGNVGAVRFSNAIGSASADYRPLDEPVDDDEGLFQRSLSIAVPRIGSGDDQCLVYIPSDSAMAAAGEDGADIGANIVFRTVDRVLSDEVLWDAETGAFPCGTVVEGINDDPESSCIGIHERLHVATPGCPLPLE